MLKPDFDPMWVCLASFFLLSICSWNRKETQFKHTIYTKVSIQNVHSTVYTVYKQNDVGLVLILAVQILDDIETLAICSNS